MFSNEIVSQIFVQGIGVIGIAASIASFQCSKHKPLLYLRTANEFFFAIQYLLLGAYTGMAMNIIGCIRNLVFTKMVEKKKSTTSARVIFSIAFLIFTALTWAGFKSVLSGFAKVLSTFAYGSKNVFFVRIMIFVTSTCWFVYNLAVRSYAGCICEFMTIISIIVGIIRVDIPNMRKNNG